MFENGIIIVGGGHGGSQLAASLRAEGYDGPLTLVTAETDIPYQRPPLSKAFLKETGHDLLPLRPESFYEKNAIRLMLAAEVESIDLGGRALRLADGAVLSFDRLALATGARPRLPPVEGTHLAGVQCFASPPRPARSATGCTRRRTSWWSAAASSASRSRPPRGSSARP